MTVEPEASKPATQNIFVQAPTAQPTNGLAVASLTLGILGCMTAWIPIVGLIAWIFAPLGLILGLVGLKAPYGRGLAIAGVICSAIALMICIAWVMLVGVAIGSRAAVS